MGKKGKLKRYCRCTYGKCNEYGEPEFITTKVFDEFADLVNEIDKSTVKTFEELKSDIAAVSVEHHIYKDYSVIISYMSLVDHMTHYYCWRVSIMEVDSSSFADLTRLENDDIPPLLPEIGVLRFEHYREGSRKRATQKITTSYDKSKLVKLKNKYVGEIFEVLNHKKIPLTNVTIDSDIYYVRISYIDLDGFGYRYDIDIDTIRVI